MKKTILLFLCILTVGLSSCKKEVLVTDPTNRTILVDIPLSNWVRATDGPYYYTNIDLPENNSNFNQSGHVIVSMSFANPDVYEGLPQVYGGASYTFNSQPGKLTIYINSVNNTTVPNLPLTVTTAKITLIDALLID